jgi:hypothetical protein
MSAFLVAALLVSSQGTEEANNLKELQKERIATLKDVMDVSFKLAKSGRLEIQDVLEDRMNLLKAELETAEKKPDRITLYKEAIESIKDFEALAKDRMLRGTGTALASLKVKAARLEIEIALEKVKGGKE